MRLTLQTSFALVLAVLIQSSVVKAQESDLMALDADSDSKVTVAEFVEYASGKLSGFDRVDEFAKAVDADGNGEISKSEFAGRMEVLQKMAEGGGDDEKSDAKEKPKKSAAKKESKAVAEAKSSFEKMKKLIRKSDWENAGKYMTASGRDEVVVEQVISSIGLTQMEMPMPIPQIEEAAEEVEEVLEEYELDKIGVDISSMFKVQTNFDGDDSEDDGGDDAGDKKEQGKKSEVEKNSKKILDAVKKSGKQWEIVNDLWKAKSSSPFSFSPLTGNVKKSEEGKDVVYLEVALAPATTDNNDGMMIQMMAPPTIIRMKKEKDAWLFDGRDDERTMKAMEKFMKENQGRMGGGGGGEPRHDF